MAPKICLDAGHYGKYNQSPANKLYYESYMAWSLHLLQKKYLEEYGFEVILTRGMQSKDKALYERGAMSEGCVLFLSNHSNAVGSEINESVDYPVAYVSIDGRGDELGQRLADCVAEVMETRQPGRISSREGSNGDYYGVIRGATAVGTIGILLEHSFHTNTRSTNWLLMDANLDRLARAEAAVIADYFGMAKPKPYYADAVAWAMENNITTEKDMAAFDPDRACTRAEALTFIWRAAGSPEPAISNPFADVKESDYFYKAVLWAKENEITAGLTETTFGPLETVTRAQIVTFLWREAGRPLYNVPNPFHDVLWTIWYTQAVLWAVEEGITEGYSATEFGTNDSCTRGQIVTFLYRNKTRK